MTRCREASPHPDPYLRAAELLGFEPAQCLAVEDSVTGTAAAEAAGCPVLVVPNDVEVPGGPRRRHVASLAELDVDDLRAIHARVEYAAGVAADRTLEPELDLVSLDRCVKPESSSGIRPSRASSCAIVDVTRITQRCGKDTSWPVRVPPSPTVRRRSRDEDFSSGGTAVRIASVAALGGLLFGYDSAVINGAVDSIQEDFGIGNAELGFAVASALLGAAAGAMTAGRIADKIGRIAVMKIAAVLFLISAIGTGFAHEVWTVVLFRIVGGIGVGVASVIAPAYIAETSPPRIRGRLGSLQQLAIVLGHLPVVRRQLAAAVGGGRAQRGAVARPGRLALDVPGDGGARRPVRRAGVHHSRSRRVISLPATRFRKPAGC